MVKKSRTGDERKRHTFVPFSERVAAIRIDPVRRKTRDERPERDSYFVAAFQRWSELDLTTNFRSFATAAAPLAQSLPMVLFNASKIADLLLDHVAKADDGWSGEPLLDLVTQFARDLGADFEPYFASSVGICIDLVQKNASDSQDRGVRVVEQAFNCMAYLFKYLSRLLVANLVPTYNLIAPLFGRDKRQRVFVVRFAAESLAFLIRRCRDESLTAIVKHVVHDSTRSNHNEQYEAAVAKLLADALLGPGTTLHSRTPALVRELLRVCRDESSSQGTILACDALVTALHHARRDSARPLYDAALQVVDESEPGEFGLAVLLVLAGLRKGDRVSDWTQIYRCLERQIRAGPPGAVGKLAAAAVLGLADFGATAKLSGQVLDALETNPSTAIAVLELLNRVNANAFSTLAPPRMGRLLDRVAPELAAQFAHETGRKVTLASLDRHETPFDAWWQLWLGHGDLVESLALPVERTHDTDMETSEIGDSEVKADILGRLLQRNPPQTDHGAVFDAVAGLPLVPSLLRGLASVSWDDMRKPKVLEKVAPKASSCDDTVRSLAVAVCSGLYPDHPVVAKCRMITDIPHDVANARNLALHIRNLSSAYSPGDAVSDALVPSFMWGLLASRFMPVWKCALECMPQLAAKNPDLVLKTALEWANTASASDAAEEDFHGFDNETTEPAEELSEVSMAADPTAMEVEDIDEIDEIDKLSGDAEDDWEKEDHSVIEPQEQKEENKDVEEESNSSGTPKPIELDVAEHAFECTWLAQFQQTGANILHDTSEPRKALQSALEDNLKVDQRTDLRILALKALCTAPRLAERAAPELVPLLLDEGSYSSIKDRLALLELFALIPAHKCLGEEQFHPLKARFLFFLGSRHADVQQLALKCVLRSEPGAPQTYRAEMAALLEDNRFRDALTTLVASNSPQLHAETERDQVLPLVLRILYGRAIGGHHRQRSAVLQALHFVEPKWIDQFVQLTVPGTRATGRALTGSLALVRDLVTELRGTAAPGLARVLDEIIVPALKASQSDKILRQLVTRCVDSALGHIPEPEVWDSRFPALYKLLIEPQLGPRFAQSNIEQVSALMRLLLTLSSEPALLRYLTPDATAGMVDCLGFENAKQPVVVVALRFVQNILANVSSTPSDIETQVVETAVSTALRHFPSMLGRSEYTPQTLSLAVVVLRAVLEKYADAADGAQVVLLSEAALKAVSSRISISTKASLLDSLVILLPKAPIELVDHAWDGLAPLFRQMSDRSARGRLTACYEAISTRIPDVSRTATLLKDLEADAAMGRPDWDRRLGAFARINEELYPQLDAREWRPLTYVMLFFARDPEELALRSNAAFSLRRLVDAGQQPLVADVVLPVARLGLRLPDERLRRPYVDLIAHIIGSDMALLDDLKPFVGFYEDILDIQIGRRRQALQSLRTYLDGVSNQSTDNSTNGAANLAHYVLPIIEHSAALAGSDDGEQNNLGQDSLAAVTAVGRHLTWNQFRAVTRRYVGLVKTRPQPRDLRRSVKLVSAMAAALQPPTAVDLVSKDVLDIVNQLHGVLASRSNEYQNLPDRIPLAGPIVQFLVALGPEALEQHLPGKLTELCHLLRSRVQELRDAIRQTLARVARLVGPRYLAFVVAELQTALKRGAQRHILGFTVHSLLVELKPSLKPGDLDGCASLVAGVIMEDVFGATGQDKDSEGYTAAAKEVRQHKSPDSMEILTAATSLNSLGLVLEPLHSVLLYTRLSLKNERKAEELLARIAAGLHHNSETCTQQGLVMCYQLHRRTTIEVTAAPKEDEKTNNDADGPQNALEAREQAARESEKFYTVQLDPRPNPTRPTARPENLRLLQALALTTVRHIFAGNPDLLSVSNVKGMLPLIEAGIHSTHQAVQVAALRLATPTLRIPLPEDLTPTFTTLVRRATALVHSIPGTESDLAQAGLKFLAMVLRHHAGVEVRPHSVGAILDKLRPDIDEPDRQGTALAYVRAVVSRQLLIPQVYDVMDRVASTLVTNQSEVVRAACRSVFLAFLIAYPHGRAKLEKRLGFLVANLQYPSASGRKSVLEMVRMVVTKVSADQWDPMQFFAGLVLVVVNDDSADCRGAAQEVIRALLDQNATEAMAASPDIPFVADQQALMGHVRSWLAQPLDAPKAGLLVRGGLEVAAMMLDVGRGFANDPQLRQSVDSVCTRILEAAAADTELPASSESVDWQLVYLALGVISKRSRPNMKLVEGVLLYPHPWVRARASRQFGDHFKQQQDSGTKGEDWSGVAQKLVRQLSAPNLAQNDALQIVKNLVFVVRATPETTAPWLVEKLSTLLRKDSSDADTVGGRTAAVQILASLPVLLTGSLRDEVAYNVIFPLYMLVDQLTSEDAHSELKELAQQALGIWEKELGPTAYLQQYTTARQFVQERRQQRRAKRSVETVINPDIAARKRIKKNVAKKDARRLKQHARKAAE